MNAENYFRDLLVEYLPRRYSIESGFVVNVDGERSDFMDVLIVDTMNIAALSAEPHFKVFPAEGVVGAMEITSAPKGTVKRSGFSKSIGKLQDDILKLSKLRGIARRREYLEPTLAHSDGHSKIEYHRLSYELSPRSFLITCGDEWVKSESYEKHLTASLRAAKQTSQTVWINAALSMRHGMFHFTPYTEFAYTRTPKNALLEFILYLNHSVSEFQTARIDVTRYRPTIPSD